MVEVLIPSPGESVTRVTLATWLVADGDFVEKDQDLAEIDSDKATLSIAAPESGTIQILIPEGSEAGVDEVIARIKPGDGEKSKTTKDRPSSGESTTDHDTSRETVRKEQEGRNEQHSEEPESAASVSDQQESEGDSAGESSDNQLPLTPVARVFMKAKGLSEQNILQLLQGERIRKKDLEWLLDDTRDRGDTVQTTTAERTEKRESLSPLRLKLSQRLVSVKNETAMLTTFNEVDMTEVLRMRKDYGARFEKDHGVKLGLMSFFTRAASMALTEFTAVNAFIERDEIVFHNYVDISIAVSGPKGLVVPVIRNAQQLSMAQIEQEVRRLADKASGNKLTLDEMTGGTFTITNGGVFGSMLSTPILNPPQSAILGMHNIVERPVAVHGNVEIRPIMYVALSYDHRIIDGRESVSFLKRIKELLEQPAKMAYSTDPYDKLLGF
jgi:2-oxoglutarate dehydrogenase E2 component (dihydrolipoamide succinyltransferase)